MRRSTRRRVVITGCGLVSGAGNELDTFWRALSEGRSFIGPLQNFSFPDVPDAKGAEVRLAPEDAGQIALDADPQRSRCLYLVRAAARRALADAGLRASVGSLASTPPPMRAAVVVGTTLGIERQVSDLNERWTVQGSDSVDAGFFERASTQHLASWLAREHGLDGPVIVSATACSSGNAALAWAYDFVANGVVDTALAGGVDTLTRMAYCGFTRMGALSKSVCKPFDRQRDGVSFGEGAGMLVLEELEHARARGARIYAELAGYGISNDAYHLTAPEQSGSGFARALRQALTTTQTHIEEVDYVSAHGTGTLYNDLGEAMALRSVFGARAPVIPINSIKSSIGHTNGAASAIEAIACSLAMVHGLVPPTPHLTDPDPELGLDVVRGEARELSIRTCINMAAGFGGFNVCTVLKEAP